MKYSVFFVYQFEEYLFNDLSFKNICSSSLATKRDALRCSFLHEAKVVIWKIDTAGNEVINTKYR